MTIHNALPYAHRIGQPATVLTPPHGSFDAMVTPHLRMLSSLARRLTHNTALAQDLLQDTLYRAYRFAHRFEAGTNCRAWLATIMRNVYISQRRKHWRQMDHDSAARRSAPLTCASQEEPDVCQLAELIPALPYLVTDDVLQALSTLSADTRMAVLLADVLEYSYEDIAALMQCRLGTVMSRLHRGREKLRARLQPYAAAQGYLRSTTSAGVSHDPAGHAVGDN